MSKVRKVTAQDIVESAEKLVEEHLHAKSQISSMNSNTQNSTEFKLSNLGKLSSCFASNVAKRFGTDEEGKPVVEPLQQLDAMVSNTFYSDSDTDTDTYAIAENVYRSNLVYDLVDWFYDHSEKFSKDDKNTAYAKAGEFFTLENPMTGAESVDWESDTGRAIASAALLGLTDTQARNSVAWLAMATTEVVEGGGDVVLTAMLTALFINDLKNNGEISESTGAEVFDALKDVLGQLTRSRDFDWRSDIMRESSRDLNKEILEAKRNYRDFRREYENASNKEDVVIGDYFKNHNKSHEVLLAVVATYAFFKEEGAYHTQPVVSADSFVEEALTTVVTPGHDTLLSLGTVAYVTWLVLNENIELV